MKTTIIFGPPGTGKTTTLLNIVEERLKRGLPPRQLGFIAFTKKAAAEAKSRALTKFGLPEADMPWYRTLHSAAFRLLGLNRSQVMTNADYFTICRHLGLYITVKNADEDGTTQGMTKGDRLFFTENMARVRGISLEEMWERYPNEDLDWVELARLKATLADYKTQYGKLDFTDMINNTVAQQLVMPVSVAFIDEAQDLSPIQWKAVDQLFSQADEVFLSGDDDQAIFKWAGADSTQLIRRNGTRNVLPQSYRVPQKIQKVAADIISRVSERVPKTWSPTKEEGSVIYVSSVEQIDMRKGTWLLLGRNVMHLEQYVDHCLRAGLVFDSIKDCPLRGTSLRAIVIWEKLRKGEKVPAAEACFVYDHLTVSVGVQYGKKKVLDAVKPDKLVNMQDLLSQYGLQTTEIWHKALDRIPAIEREYFLNALRQGEKLLREPRIKISTIHGAKGGEADNVVVMTDMANRTWLEFEDNPEDEHRVWYVAVTRAKKNLFILEPSTNKSYTI